MNTLVVQDLHGRINISIDARNPVALVGPNMAGKSSVLNAALAVMTCDSGRYGDQPASALLEVTVNGIPHTMTLGANAEHTIARRRVGTKAAKEQRAALLGRAPMWNIADFMALSRQRRTAFLAEEIVRASWTLDEVNAALAPASSVRVMIEAIAASRGLRGVMADVDTMHAALSANPSPMDALIRVLADEVTQSQAHLNSLRGAIAQDDAQQADDLPPGTVASWREVAARAQEALQALRHQLGDEQRVRARRTAIGAEIDTLTADIHALQATRAKREAERNTLDAEVPTGDIAKLRKQREDTARALADVRQELRDSEKVYTDLVGRAARAQGEAVSGRALREILDAAERVTKHVTGDPIVDMDIGLLADAIREMPRPPNQADIEALKAQIVTKSDEVAALQRLVQVAERRSADAANALQSLADALERQRLAEVRRREVSASIAALTSQIDSKASVIETLQREMAALPEITVDEAVAARMWALTAEHDDAMAKADRLNDVLALEAVQAHRRQQRDAVEAATRTVRALSTTAQAARTSLLDAYRDPVSQIAGGIVERVLKSTLRVSGGDITLTDARGVTYSVDTASDGERVIVLLAFEIAVRSRMTGWRPAFVDRLDALTPSLRERFADELLSQFTEGHLDTLMVATHCEDTGGRAPTEAQIGLRGFNVVYLEAARASA